MREKICEWKQYKRKLKIIVWNCQTLNKIQYDRRKIKVQNMIKMVNDYFPDVIYLIDANKQLNIGGNYETHYDGRNILFTRKDIEMIVKIGEGMNWMEIENLKLGFIYIIPNNYDKVQIEKRIAYWNLKGFTFMGDFNLRSNEELKKMIKWNGGETTLQTGISGKIEEVKLFPAPSDHNALLITVKRKIKASSMIDIVKVNQKYKKIIEGYLEGNVNLENMAKSRYKLIRVRFCDSEENAVMFRVIKAFYKGRVQDLYNRFGWLWRSSKKEPFLGKKIPVKVFQSFKDEMYHNKDKIYLEIDEKNCPDTFNEAQINQWKKVDFRGNITNFKVDLKGMQGSYSKAVTMENIEIRKIINHMKYVIKKWIMEKQEWKVRNILSNIVKDHNQILQKGYKMYHMTFFLKKNKVLNSYRDVRMITICPTLLRIYEALIYDTVLPEIANIIKKENYQYGAFPGSSTYDYLNVLRFKVNRYNAKGIISLDITKGYERINHRNLSKAIDMIESVNCKRLLEIWSTMVWNTDYMINGQLVKTTRGIPMGLALSPLVFVLYLHYALKDCDKEMIMAYMDDISILMLEDQASDNMINNTLKALTDFGLDINERKSAIFTDGEWFTEERKQNFRIGDKGTLEVKSVAMILGRELSWSENIITGDRCNFVMEHKIPRIMPNWMTLAMRRLIYIGGLTGKERYISYMWAFKRKDVKQKMLKNAYNFFAINFEQLNYVQVFMIIPNILREFIDPYWMLELRDKVKFVIDSYDIEEENINDDVILSKIKVMFQEQNNNMMNLVKEVLEPFSIDMEQFDIDIYSSQYEEAFVQRFIWELYSFPKDPVIIWNKAKEILNTLWPLFVAAKLDKWNEKHKLDKKKHIDIIDKEIMTDFVFKSFKSLKKFAILLDLLFAKISWNDYSDWSFFIFDMIEKLIKVCKEGDITEESLFEVRRRIFAVNDPDDLEEKRYDLASKVLKEMSKAEREFFGFPLHRFKPYKDSKDYETKLQQYETWTLSKLVIKRYRKILFVLDSMYAQKKNYKSRSYSEIMAQFQLKYWLCHDSYEELERVHLIQDYEDYDQPWEDEEASFCEMDDSSVE